MNINNPIGINLLTSYHSLCLIHQSENIIKECSEPEFQINPIFKLTLNI